MPCKEILWKELIKKLGILLLAAAFAVCGLMTFAACNEETLGPGDDPIVTPGPDDPNDPGKPEEPTPPDEPEATEGLVFELLTTENSDVYDQNILNVLGEGFEDCYMCTGLTAAEENVVIPSIYNGLPVRVVIWASLEPEISNRIVSIYIPDSIQFVGFAYYYYNNSDYENLTEIRLPRNPNAMIYGSIYLSGCAFYNDPSNWDNGALYMDEWLLATNGDLPEEYTVKQGTYGIAAGAFAEEIRGSYYESHVKKVTVPDSVQALFGSFVGCVSLEEVVLSDSLSSIGIGAFSGCESLESITIPDGVTSIGLAAFFWCDSLTSIVIPDGITSIGSSAFSGCSSLTSIVIPDSVTLINFGTFQGCSSLTSIVIPDGVTFIGYSAFGDCDSLETVYYRGSEEEWNEIEVESANGMLEDVEIVFNYTGE